MTVGRTDLARAFDDMKENQDGIRFQRVAVQLVRRDWPEIIASEPGKDLGADARVPQSLAPDGVGKVLACSITPTYAKIRNDARKVVTHFPNVRVLIFATPAAVTNQLAAGWIEQIKEEFGIELIVISREDLISRLLETANAPALQLLLGLAGTTPPKFERLCSEVAIAASENVDLWFAHRRLAEHPSLNLHFATVERDGKIGERVDFYQITQLLSQGRRVLLEAPPGAGKTTTHVQIARFFADHGIIPILVHLPEWGNSAHGGLCDFVAGSGPFQARSIHAAQLLQVIQQRPAVVLLNGWNELSAAALDLIEQRIQAEDRQLPETGFMIATRGHRLRPPLQGLSRITILKLDRTQRRAYLVAALGADGDALANEVEGNRALDDLTRTPFILHEVVKLKQAGRNLPSTRMGILAEVSGLFEQNPEHRNALLREPLNGMASTYLSALAQEMTGRGDTVVSEQAARGICSAVSRRLIDQGQIEHAANPSEVLGALSDHHVLERTLQTAEHLQFEHQQFQEFYSARALEDALDIAQTGAEQATSYRREYIDSPAWEQPLTMLAEKVDSDFENAQDLAVGKARLLVSMAAEIDLFFAGTLARLCGRALPADARTALTDRLRRWHAIPDEAHQEMALAAIFETGLPEFAEMIVPLLISHSQQTRLGTYRNAKKFHTSILGEDWQAIVPAWEEDARREFVSELTVYGGRADIAEYFALEDPSMDLRKSAIQLLTWERDKEKIARTIKALPETERDGALLQLSAEEVPEELLPEARAAQERRLATETDHVRRVQLILQGRELGTSNAATALKDELERGGVEGFTHLNNRILGEALLFLRESDKAWVSSWVASQVTANTLSFRMWGELVAELPEDVQQGLMTSISSTDLGHHRSESISVLAAAIGVERMADAFGAYCAVKSQIRELNPPFGDVRFAIVRQLEELFRDTAASVTVAAVSGTFDRPIEEHILRCVTNLMNGVGRWSGDGGRPLDLRPELSEELRQRFRAYLKKAVPFACALEDLEGSLLANLSSTLSRIGDPEDIDDLAELVKADIARWRAVREAQAARRRVQATGWAMWHIRALLSLGAENTDEVLIRLLDESHYCVDAARGLLELARIEQQIASWPFKEPDFNQIWMVREGKSKARFEESRRQRYSAAIRSGVERQLEAIRAMEHPADHSQALHELAGMLALLDGAQSAGLVCDAAAVPARSNSWHRVEALRQVLFCGGSVPFVTANAILREVIAQAAPHGFYQDDQSMSRVTSILCLMPFTDDPEQGVATIREVLAGGRLYGHVLRGVITALGYSRAPGALTLLTEISGPGSPNLSTVGSEWIEAISNIGGRDAAEALFAFVESAQNRPNASPPHEHHLFELAATRLATLVQVNDDLKSHILGLVTVPGTPERDFMLIKSIVAMNSLDALLSTMNLAIVDRSHRWPYFVLEEAFQDLCLIKRPTHPDSNSYTLEPKSATELRRKLMEIVTAGGLGAWNAFSLLGRIAVWRLEHGKPPREPRHPYLGSGLKWPSLELFENPGD